MSVKAEPWQKAEIAGPKKALLILKPEVVVAMIKRAKRPIQSCAQRVQQDGPYFFPDRRATGFPGYQAVVPPGFQELGNVHQLGCFSRPFDAFEGDKHIHS